MNKLTRAKEAYFNCDFKTAFQLFKELAARGNAEAQCFLGEFYDDFGRGFPVDFVKARKLYERSLEDRVIARPRRSSMNFSSTGTNLNPPKACRCPARYSIFERATTKLFLIYRDEKGVKYNKRKLNQYYGLAFTYCREDLAMIMRAFYCMKDGKKEYMENDLMDYYEDENTLIWRSNYPEFARMYGNSLLIFAKYSQKRSPLDDALEAQKNPEGIKKIEQEIADLRERFNEDLSAEFAGTNAPAQHIVIGLLAKYLEAKNELELAEKCYQKATESGSGGAFLAYANFLENHNKPGADEMRFKGIEIAGTASKALTIAYGFLMGNERISPDKKRAEFWYRKTLELADPKKDRKIIRATHYVLSTMERARGNAEKAIEHLKITYKLGEKSAAKPLARILNERNDPEAFPWAKKAAKLGDAEAKEILATCYRDGTGTPVA